MISSLKISNFKSIQEVEITLSNFNLFCGTNSSGKSSLLHALLVLAQNCNQLENDNAIINGNLVQLGGFTDIKNSGKSNSENTLISGTFASGDDFLIEISNDFDSSTSSEVMRIKNIKNIDKFIFENSVFYLSSNRIGDIELHDRTSDNHFGTRGQFAFDYLINNANREIPQELSHNNQSSATLLNETNYWLEKIIGARMTVESVSNTSKLVATYQNIGSRNFVRSINIGTGISYLISIIILCLGVVSSELENSNHKPLIIIENPEIHLHPKAQSYVTEFLLYISNYAQLVLETQSDHVFNRYRVHVKEKDAQVVNGKVFFSEYINEQSLFEEIKIDKRGTVLNDRKNLFDQFEADLIRLLR
ncbi:AAA family ATPase [Erysipelothrix rhusiopathiae]|uniref:AAA family ATPase n=1 Tax=Erysipelothrix rhusiopathiae TaxID=1648 RepID=UPI0024809D10|nr:AAA family ATPase [Erysipelothrix rhusiopathiae]